MGLISIRYGLPYIILACDVALRGFPGLKLLRLGFLHFAMINPAVHTVAVAEGSSWQCRT